MKLNLDGIKKICALGTQLTGIEFKPSHYQMVESRLKIRISQLGLVSLEDYLSHLEKNSAQEKDYLVSLMTTHHTYFFREFNHFEFLIREGLAQVVEQLKAKNEKLLKVWCAASSTGEEAYSLALFLDYHLKQIAPQMDYVVYATDIDPISVQKAQNGVYKNEDINQSPNMYIDNKIVKGTGTANGFSKVKKEIKSKVHFGVLNLFHAADYQPSLQFDLIFCRNVFIYFKQDDVKKISKILMSKLSPFGYLVTGVSESLTRLDLEIKSVATCVYQSKSAQTLKVQKLQPLVETNQTVRILCIDDSPTVTSLLKKVLSVEKNYKVTAVAKDGQEALSLLQTQEFDLVTLDLNMPVLDGVGFLKKYKGSAPVLVISSINREDMSLAQEALRLGAKDYVEKPSLNDIDQSGNQIRSKIKMILAAQSVTSSAKVPQPSLSRPPEHKIQKINQPVLTVSPASFQGKPFKVLILDDSQTVLSLLDKMISSEKKLVVVSKIDDSRKLESEIEKHKPDVITLDIHMPHIDGLQALEIIQNKYQIPTVMISSMNKEDGSLVMKAMGMGAKDFIQKPTLLQFEESRTVTCERLLAAAESSLKKSKATTSNSFLTTQFLQKKLILVGSSTGGTEAIRMFLQKLPPQVPPIVIVQHIPESFSESLASHINDLVPFEVKEAKDGDQLTPNKVFIARGGKQLKITESNTRNLVLKLTDDPPMNRHKPSVDYLFKSAYECSALNSENTVAIMLTGMGADGAAFMKKLHDKGVQTIAQNEETCVVFGMPREAIRLGAVDHVLPLDDIAQKAIQILSSSTENTGRKKSA